jgi:Fic family protein
MHLEYAPKYAPNQVISMAQIEYPDLIELVARYPDGVAVEALEQALQGGISRRTLQRRLAELVESGQLQKTGQRRGTRYQTQAAAPIAISGVVKSGQAQSAQAYGEVYVPISKESGDIKAYVRQALHMRRPVGYDWQFLEQYIPNQTTYLPEHLRQQLHAMGRTAGSTSSSQPAPAGTFARDIINRLLIDLSWASSQLEGNTYSHLDTKRLIELGQVAEGKDAVETQMILNHKQAIEYLVHHPEHLSLTPQTIIELHALLSDGLLADPLACGRVRQRAVEISGSVYRPLALPQRLDELLTIVTQTARDIHDPFEQSLFLMVHLPYLQPFEDVNKRVSRLAANIPLMAHNLCPLSFVDVPQQAYVDAMLGVYEMNRVELLSDVFVWAYERSCQQYVAVKQSLVPPDMMRLRHRSVLGELIASIVRQGLAPTREVIMQRMPASVPLADQDAFITLVMSEFKTLHAGNAVRFGIRPLELQAWQKQSL